MKLEGFTLAAELGSPAFKHHGDVRTVVASADLIGDEARSLADGQRVYVGTNAGRVLVFERS